MKHNCHSFLILLSAAFLFQRAPVAGAAQLPNLTDPAPAARFTLTGKDWPASPGGASICLWADDKLAAFSLSVDDNSESNVSWWLDQADDYGFKVTWFVITDYLSDSHSYTGTWPQYAEVLARGQDVQSHSCTHSNSVAEYRDSQIAIETNLPGHKCEFLAYPGGTPAGTADPVAAAQYYAGARGGTGAINIANKISYMQSCGMSAFNLTNATWSWSYLPNLFVTNSPYYRGWAVQLFHYISDYSTVQPLIDFYAANSNDLWSAFYGDMSKYGQERDTATLTVTTNADDLITLTLTDQMLDSRFNYPLTIKVRLPASWTEVQATQNGSPVESTVVQHSGANYALVKAVPDQGVIALTGDLTPQMTNTLTQFGITWTFDTDYPVGQYANGDWWVVGPINIISVTNNYHTNGISPAYGEDGCMINPGTNDKQGYDIRLQNYQSALNKSYPNGASISSGNPLALAVNSSLISSVSWLVGEPGCPTVNTPPGGPRPSVRTMAILTCVSNAPSAGAFRPPYCGTDKISHFNISQLDYSRLGNLPPVASTPSLATVEENFDGPWVDHVYTWIGGYTHPWEHMPNYGRDMSVQISEAALMLQLDFSQLPGSPSKKTLLMRIAQMGIDFTGIADNGGGWQSDGGHHMGRKFPILLAGRVLHDSHMENVGQWTTEFQEDLDTFYVSQAEVDMTHSAAWAPDTRAGVAPYETNNIGLPEWGIRHVAVPASDNLHWNCTYRSLNNLSYPGWVLATLIMGQRTEWNHEALFDYIDRAVAVGPYEYFNDYYRYGGTFIGNMWKAYRANYPPQWVPYDDADFYSPGTLVSSGAVAVANFSATPTAGTAPLTVTFTDTSSGIITNRFWDFGDGATTNTTAPTVVHTYVSAGTRTVKLIVSGSGGTATNTQANFINVTVSALPPSEIAVVSDAADLSIGLNASLVPVLGYVANASLAAGDDNYTYGSANICGIAVFRLPDIGGQEIVSANLSADVTCSYPGGSDPYPKGLDLYAVRWAASSAVRTNDYGFKGNGSGTLIQQNFFSMPSHAIYAWAAYETDSAADSTLAAWLTAQYAAGARAGDYVFIRFEANGNTANAIMVAAADNTSQNPPVLTIGIAGSTIDNDSDGLPNDWETLYFGGATNANPGALASNGVNTVLETYIAGLDPTDPASGFTVSNDWKTLQWTAVSGRVYSVWWTTNLLSGFQCLESNITWPRNIWTSPVADGESFYRLKVELMQ